MSTTAPRSLAFYLRVSTISQDYPSQLHALKEFCRRQGWAVPPKARVFAEKITGKHARRTQLDRLLSACRDGHVDAILVYKIDRLGNSFQHLVNLQAQLDTLKIRVIGVSDGIDTATNNAAANMYRNTLNSAAQFNREIISERTRAGQAAARQAGRFAGRPRRNQAKIDRALKLASKGKYGAEIARTTGLSPAYVSMLMNGRRSAQPKPRKTK